jgi:hypothetical protein
LKRVRRGAAAESPLQKRRFVAIAEPRVGPSLGGLSTDNFMLRHPEVARSFLWLLLPLQISNAGRGTLNLDSPKNRLLFKHFSHFFRALSEPFLKFANQLVIFAFGVG